MDINVYAHDLAKSIRDIARALEKIAKAQEDKNRLEHERLAILLKEEQRS